MGDGLSDGLSVYYNQENPKKRVYVCGRSALRRAFLIEA
jgi:hypothetical protein